MNVVAHFDRQARETPDALALHWAGGRMSYGELHDLAHRFAQVLHQQGVTARDRVAILLPNDPAFAVALLGLLWHGAAAVVLSPAWAPADAARALAEAEVRLLVTTEGHAAALQVPRATALITDDAHSMGSFGAALRAVQTDPPHPIARRAVKDTAAILFSSGTTGDPKGVVLTHGNLAFNALSKIRYCGITSRDRLGMVVPMAHCFGQNVVLLGALLAGAAVRIHARFDAISLHEDIARGDVTMVLAAPTAFARLLALDDISALPRLRYALTAAAPLAEGLAARWRVAAGRPLAQGYGLTECSPFATYDESSPDTGRRVGHAIAGVEVRVAGPDGIERVAPGEPGEVLVRGPNVMAGYWRRPAETARTLRGGWLHTGDVGYLDDTGALHLVDRVDDVINVAGFKAWPSDVERVLARHEAVEEVAVYGVPDADRGASVAAAIVLRRGATADLAAIASFAAERLATFQRPTQIRVVEALPRSASGKVLRRALARDVDGARALEATGTRQ